MVSPAGKNSADALPDPFSITGRGTELNSSRAGVRPTTDAAEAEMVADASGTARVIAISVADEVVASLTSSGSSVEA